jgi:hypothetical protein
MKTFKHKMWNGKRDYECTNVIACQAESAPSEWWIECGDDSILTGLNKLWIERGVQYYGHL